MTDPAFLTRPDSADRRLLTTPPHAPRPSRLRHGVSPSVDAVRRDPARADLLWSRLRREGTPLIEDGLIEDSDGEDSDGVDDGTRLFTWVHRGPARRVVLVAGKLADPGTVDDVALTPVPRTDLWTLTLRLGAGWRGMYGLAVVDETETESEPDDQSEEFTDRRGRSIAATDVSRRDDVDAWYRLLAAVRPDPLAREQFRGTSVAAGPAAPRARPTVAPDNPGRTIPVEIDSAAVGIRRGHWFVPATAGPDPAVVVLLDGDRRLADGRSAFGAWMHTHLAPNTVALLLGHGDIVARDADLTCNPALVDDVCALLDAAPIPTTADPARTLVQGSSLGGLSALYAQCLAPHRFGVSVCQSPSLWWPNARSGNHAEWLTDTLAASDSRLGKVHLSVGTDEWVLVDPVRRMRDVLVSRTERLDYHEFDGGHDIACWDAALPAVFDRFGFGA